MIFMLAMFVAYIIYVISSIYKDEKDIKPLEDGRNKISILLRMIMNHLHLIGITLSYSFNWPPLIDTLSDYLKISRDVNTSFVSFDWLFEGMNPEKVYLKPWQLQNYIYWGLPLLIVIFSYGLWGFHHFWCQSWHRKLRRNSTELLDNKLWQRKSTTTIIVIYMLALPSMVNTFSEMYNMVEIKGAGYSIIAIDSSQKVDYFDIRFLSCFICAIVGTVIWGPICLLNLFRILRKIDDRNKIDDNWYEYGYLYNGYRYNTYYWELIIQFRKVLLIVASTSLSTKGKLYQDIVLMIIISIFLIVHLRVGPFHDITFNFLESFSLFTASILVYLGYLMSNENYSMSSNRVYQDLISYIMMVIFFSLTALYLIFWSIKLINELSNK